MKTTSILFLGVLGVFFTSCENNNQNQLTEKASITQQPKQLSEKEKEFVKDAAKSNMLEVELGTLANQKASTPEVKDFAQEMVRDHKQANNKLKQVVENKNIQLPDSLSEEGRNTKQDLAKLSGKKFEKEYVEEMVNDHKKAVKKFEDMTQQAEDPAVKKYAQQTLPTLKNHYMEVQRLDSLLQAREKKKSNNKTSMK